MMAKRAARRPSAPAKTPGPRAGKDRSSADKPTETRRSLAILGLILLATTVIYWPSLSGKKLWDDDGHITRQDLRGLDGLARIWWPIARHNPAYNANDPSAPYWLPGATQQYYPLLHSAFWLEYALWNGSMVGYHVVNLALHLAATTLVYFILRKLRIPGALFAAALFALHPVQVETVAWITEQKNTLSAVFYLAALLAYLNFDERRTAGWYALALLLFTLGLLSKTVTATLPAAIIVMVWWRQGKLSWNRDIVPLMPFFALGAAFGLLTAWVEAKFIGAEGKAFELSLIARCVLAGRVVWFYLYKLLWPAELVFVYPRWSIQPDELWQWLFAVAAIAVTIALWFYRRRSRAPLAAWLFFVGTLFPVLGFFNVFPFMFSFVADHFQYLASLGVIVFVAGACLWGIARLQQSQRRAAYAACVAVVAVLAVLTRWQIPMYADAVTLYRTTIERNPNAWMAYNNLGGELYRSGPEHLVEATQCFQDCLRLNPDYPEALNNLAAVMIQTGRPEEAIPYAKRALEVRPAYSDAECNLGNSLFKLRRVHEALPHLELAVTLEPTSADAHNSLAVVLFELNRRDEALEHLSRAMELKPEAAEIQNNAGVMLTAAGRLPEAIDHLKQALTLQPNYPEANGNLADALDKAGQEQLAIEFYGRALAQNPNYALAHTHLALVLYKQGKTAEAVEYFEQGLRLDPNDPQANNNFGHILSTLGRYEESVRYLETCIRLRPNSPDAYFNLGNTLNAMGRLSESADAYARAVQLKPDYAAAWANLAALDVQLQHPTEGIAAGQKALELARSQGLTDVAARVEAWLAANGGASSSATPAAAAPGGNTPASTPPAPALPPPLP